MIDSALSILFYFSLKLINLLEVQKRPPLRVRFESL